MPITIDLSGKNALVTGGTRVIGRTISIRLAEAGARVGMIYRSDSAAAEDTLRSLTAVALKDHFAIQADIADLAQTDAAMKEIVDRTEGALDILVLNAASGGSGPIAEISPEDWERAFDVNVHGHQRILQHSFPAMQRGGAVVFISSGAGHDPIAGLGAYGASKAAVNHMAAVLAQEWGPRGIRVNVVSPGHTAVNPVDYQNLSEKQKGIVEGTALRRIGTPDDVANAVLILVGDLAGFITGQAVRVNGGRV
jgi:3-oxoacyl-[acyl-carrier protein] reductase